MSFMKKIFILLYTFISIQLLAQVPLTPWTAQGPNLFPIHASGQINGIGRISQVKFSATDTSTMYAVSASVGCIILII